MLEYSELKQAVDDGYIKGDTVMIVRKDGKIFDYVLPGEPVRPWEVVSELKFCPKSAPNYFQSLPNLT
ncbi:TPA: Paratox [Streptococcus suis]